MKILFTGGGTAGHILPIIAVAREIRNIYTGTDLSLSYMGPKDGFSKVFLSQENISVRFILAGKMRRYLGFQAVSRTILDVCVLTPFGILQSLVKLFFVAPDLVFCKGGYGSLPPTIAAWLLRIPVFLHESDVTPGLANRIAAFFAVEIFTSFPDTAVFPKKKMLVVGNPVRREVLTGSAKEARELFHLKGGKPLVLILGGSQGSQKINDTILAVLHDLLESFEIIHQTGEKNYTQVQAEAKVMIQPKQEVYYHPVSILKETELRHAYAAADFVVNRSGSGSIFEIAAMRKPSILIPLTISAQNHQIKNAYAYCGTGACDVLEESNLSPHFFLEKLRYLLATPSELDKMAKAAATFSKPAAATIIAQYILEYLRR